MLLPLPLLLLLLVHNACVSNVHAGSVNKGGTCNQANNRLETGTYQFYSDCDSVTYCASNSTCLLRGCRRDVFPFGYPKDSNSLPPLCKSGTFCPDEMDACQPLLSVGSACQLNRDDQCQPPPNYFQLADRRALGLNYDGSVCINNVCMWANVTVGSTCVVENTAYIAYGANGDEFVDIVSRGNCRLGLYCDSQKRTCMAQKPLHEACDADKECLSFNCLSTGVCGKDAAAPNHFETWVYILVALSFFGGMGLTLYALIVLHRRQRAQMREKRIQYWREQNMFFENIRQMRDAAEASISSLPSRESPRGTSRRDSADVAPTRSGLRHLQEEDDSGPRKSDEIVMEPRIRPLLDGRF